MMQKQIMHLMASWELVHFWGDFLSVLHGHVQPAEKNFCANWELAAAGFCIMWLVYCILQLHFWTNANVKCLVFFLTYPFTVTFPREMQCHNDWLSCQCNHMMPSRFTEQVLFVINRIRAQNVLDVVRLLRQPDTPQCVASPHPIWSSGGRIKRKGQF